MRWRTFPHPCRLLARAGLLLFAASACGQGQFGLFNPQARTRVGSLDGPYANSNYWGQILVGTSADALSPVSMPVRHHGGYVGDGGTTVTLPESFACYSTAYFQLVAWNGNLWGSSLDGVPLDQLGRTDIVFSGVACYPAPIYPPPWTRAAIVPVPEPSVVTLAVVGAGLLLWRWRSPVRKGKAGHG